MPLDHTIWRSRCTVTRQTNSGRDPVTLLPSRTTELILLDEPCDLATRTRTVIGQGESGPRPMRVTETTLRLEPSAGETAVPDEDDHVTVDGVAVDFVDGVDCV